MSYSLMIHGGAGSMSSLAPEEQQNIHQSLQRILEAGRKLLAEGGTALEAVTLCASLLEDDPLYNAGRGSVLDHLGNIEMDAAVMDGTSLAAGAVAGVQRIKNPIRLARAVMEQTEHVMLIGQGAMEFAQLIQSPMEEREYFLTEKRQQQWEVAKKEAKAVLDLTDMPEKKFGTIGAVARDMQGNIAAATSTGGITNKQFGRVGDSPIVGAGVYADTTTCAVSATGYGEQFIRTVLSKTIADYMDFKDASIGEAVHFGMEYLTKKVRGLGGVIALDAEGTCQVACTTEGIIHGWIERAGATNTSLFAGK